MAKPSTVYEMASLMPYCNREAMVLIPMYEIIQSFQDVEIPEAIPDIKWFPHEVDVEHRQDLLLLVRRYPLLLDCK